VPEILPGSKKARVGVRSAPGGVTCESRSARSEPSMFLCARHRPLRGRRGGGASEQECRDPSVGAQALRTSVMFVISLGRFRRTLGSMA
jgi:hypothetical protein